jgi:chaperonin GroES
MAKLTPLGERVLVRRVQEAETVRGGIIIPDTAKEKPQEGVVVAVGTGRYEKGQHIPMTVKEGDRVLFGKYSGSDIKIDDEEFLILKEEEIFGILSGAAKHVEKEKATAGRR